MRTKRKRVLIISAPAPNYLSTITVSTAKVISAMSKDGWDVDIIGFRGKRGGCQVDSTLSSLIKGARIFESGSIWDKPSTWTLPAIKIAKKLVNNYSYDLAISFAHYTWAHVVGYYIKKIFNLPWIAFFSDPWGNNPDLKISLFRRFMEKQTLHLCDAVVYSNHHLKDWALSQFSSERTLFEKKSFVIPYFYDSRLFPKISIPSQNRKMIIRHMGQVPIGGYILNLLHGLKMLIDEDNSLKNRLLFEFYGRVNPAYNGSVERLVNDLGLREQVVFNSESNKIIHVPYIESLRLMIEADALLLLGVHPSFFHGWGDTVLHVKLVDYIGAHKPIFALTGEGSITHKLLGDNNGVCTDGHPLAIKKALAKFIANPPMPSLKIQEQFSRDKVYPLWQEVFNKVLGNV